MSHKKTSLKQHQPVQLPPASILRLLGAWIYDFMLLCAVWLLAGIVYIIPAQMFVHVDSSNTQNLSTTHFSGPLFYSYLFIVTWFFFAWFWRHGGQTLGLRSWSLRLQSDLEHGISWTQTLLRFFAAGFPWVVSLFLYARLSHGALENSPWLYAVFLIGFIGLFWKLVDKEKRSIQDIFSDSHIVVVPRVKKIKSGSE